MSNKVEKIASKLLLSYLIQKIWDGWFVFYNNHKYPLLMVKEGREDKYDVYKLVTFPSFLKRVKNMSESECESFYKMKRDDYRLRYWWDEPDDFVYERDSTSWDYKFKDLKKYVASNTVLCFKAGIAISDEIIDWKKENLSIIELAKILMKELNVSIPEIEKMFEQKVTFSERSEEKGDFIQFKYNKWDVVFDNGVKNKNEIIKLLDIIENKCGQYKSKLCYGLVEVKKKLGTNVLADYIIGKDTMRIKGKKADSEFVASFIHELGHRLWYEYLSPQVRSLVKNKYLHLLSDDKFIDLKIGDIISLKSGFKIKIDKVNSKDYVGILLEKPLKNKKFKEGEKVTLKPVNENSVDELNDKKFTSEMTEFPSGYSKKNPEEFFAECFSHLQLGTLNKSLEKWFKEIL